MLNLIFLLVEETIDRIHKCLVSGQIFTFSVRKITFCEFGFTGEMVLQPTSQEICLSDESVLFVKLFHALCFALKFERAVIASD